MLSRCAIGDRLRLRDGSAVLTFDAGVQVTVFGPADFEITSATSIHCRRGRVTTLVDHRGKGFSIETPQAKVVDLGTQFGLSISDKGETEVVVFQGSIDLSYAPGRHADDASSRRMQQGDALLLKNSGEIERLVSVQRNSFMGSAERSGQRSSSRSLPMCATTFARQTASSRIKSCAAGWMRMAWRLSIATTSGTGSTARGCRQFLVGRRLHHAVQRRQVRPRVGAEGRCVATGDAVRFSGQ